MHGMNAGRPLPTFHLESYWQSIRENGNKLYLSGSSVYDGEDAYLIIKYTKTTD